MKGAASHAHVETTLAAIGLTVLAVMIVAAAQPFGLRPSTVVIGLPWWLWLAAALYGVIYPLRKRAWRRN